VKDQEIGKASPQTHSRQLAGGGSAALLAVPNMRPFNARQCCYRDPAASAPPGFTSKCFSTSAGNKSSRRSRIACPHIDARERFNNFEICAADAVGRIETSFGKPAVRMHQFWW
jgi:hypothetical protein